MKRKILLAAILCTLGSSVAQTNNQFRYQSDKFEGTAQSSVVYNINTPQQEKQNQAVRGISCYSRTDYNIIGANFLSADKTSNYAMGIRIIGRDESSISSAYTPIPKDAQLILLVDGKSIKINAYDGGDKRENYSCTSSDYMNNYIYTKYEGFANFDVTFDINEFANADLVEYRLYSTKIQYTGVIPKDVRQGLKELWGEDLAKRND